MKNILCKAIIILLAALLLLTSCSEKNEVMEDNRFDGFDVSSKEEIAPESGSAGSLLEQNQSVENTAAEDRKIIETITMSIQTKEFDSFIANLELQVTALKGYVENSSVNGRGFDSSYNRYATYTVRIPASASNEFTSFISGNSVVTNKSISTKDVTLSYVDMESRVSALEAEKTALEKLLKDAETVTDIVSIRDKLTDVIYEIESYKSQLRAYDNLVEYSTIIISIYEVERTAIVEEQTTFQKISTNLKENFEDVWFGIVSVFIFMVSSIPYLIPITLVATIVIIILRRKAKRKLSSSPKENKE